jgi:hypothetical protein
MVANWHHQAHQELPAHGLQGGARAGKGGEALWKHGDACGRAGGEGGGLGGGWDVCRMGCNCTAASSRAFSKASTYKHGGRGLRACCHLAQVLSHVSVCTCREFGVHTLCTAV